MKYMSIVNNFGGMFYTRKENIVNYGNSLFHKWYRVGLHNRKF